MEKCNTKQTGSQQQQMILGNNKNYLLVKDDVGKSKPTTRALPPEHFAFGKPDPTNQETAASGKLTHASIQRGFGSATFIGLIHP